MGGQTDEQHENITSQVKAVADVKALYIVCEYE